MGRNNSVAKRRKRTKRSVQHGTQPPDVYLSEYEITAEPIEEGFYKRLPAAVKDSVERLHEQAQTRPQTAIPELLQLIEQYPKVPMLYNYLSVAYSRAGERAKAEATILANYQQNPEYLFARVNYAELYLMRGQYEKVAEIFDHKFDLKLLYPKRERFHVTEFTGFMGVVGVYFLATGQRELAEQVYGVLMQVAPDHQLTRRLGRKLHPNLLQRVLRRIARSAQ
jgi:tetratricopeptide (TPR) repeat protein